ncbi:molybdenum cofactor guanylyltransferase [uncultured Psychroserpens sp.]|uniref:molybdenum cofactor guanylyltransferase n=1 Tax=uncultured Psychroserpens sp. TaxID=255436 RepID=UPI0026029D6B|nr:molybdenum cofactor guanylyltransferase [uncultured Psychroserpens sp.]
MTTETQITGIILAGGKSSRMGFEKGLALYKNKPFIVHIIEALQSVLKDIIIVSSNKSYDQFNLKRVHDIIENAGPLAGLYSGLSHSKTENNIVLSCDIPLINPVLLTRLINEISIKNDIVQFSINGRTNPLLAVYKKRCMAPSLEALKRGERRLQFFVNQQKTKTITLESYLEKYTLNINTKDQLNQLSHDFKN